MCDHSWHLPCCLRNAVIQANLVLFFSALVESQTAAKVADAQSGAKVETVALELTKRLTLLELREVCSLSMFPWLYFSG